MKRLLGIFLALLVFLTLVACGTQVDEEGLTTNAAAEDSTNSTNSEEENTSETASETVKLVMSCGFGSNDIETLALTYLCDYIEENSGGSISFDRYLGGTLCSLPEEYGMLTSGAVDLILLLPDMAISTLPYLNFPAMVMDSQQLAIDQFNYLVFENEETASLISAQAEQNNVKVLGTNPAGFYAFISSKEVTDLSGMSNLKMGCSGTQDKYIRLGLTTVSVNSSDIYDSLSRGVFDCTAMSLPAVISNKWYEVAPYCLLMGGYQASPYYVMNNDTWNSLSAEQQQVISDGVQAAIEYSLNLLEERNSSAIETIESAGGVVNYFSEEDTISFVKEVNRDYVDASRLYAENLGCQEDMEIIIEAACEFIGIDVEEFAQ